jgi:hypothetical protein
MKTSHMIGAALLAAGVFVGSGQLASALESTSADVTASLDSHEMAIDSPTAGEKAAPQRYGKGPTRGGGGRGGRGCGCG